MDISPLLHALCAVAAPDTGWSFAKLGLRAIAGCTFFIAREHTGQNIAGLKCFGHGKRMNMPWWGGFDPRAWDVASLMDFCCAGGGVSAGLGIYPFNIKSRSNLSWRNTAACWRTFDSSGIE